MDRRVVLAATLPVFAMLLLVNVAAWWIAAHVILSPIGKSAAAAQAKFERVLGVYVGEMGAIAGLPMSDSLLTAGARHAKSAQKRTQAAETAEQWSGLSRDDFRVREVMDSTLAEAFRGVASGDPAILNIYLTDASGVVLAAAEKPPAYNLAVAAWWPLIQKETNAAVISEGLVVPVMLGLTMPIRHRSSGNLRGALRLELDVKRLVNAVVDKDGAHVLALAGSAVVTEDRFAEQTGGAAESLEAVLAKKKDGRHRGFRFKTVNPAPAIHWGDPLRLVVVRREGGIILSLVVFLGALLVVSICGARCWAVFCRRAFGQCVVTPQMDLLEAGDWILRTALSRTSMLKAPDEGQGTDPHKAGLEATPIQKELQQWLHGLLQDLQEEYTSHTHEMQRDLGLARDFQQAYMDRPYPKVPAVHVEGRLRLDFYHRYEPALALGGDFYNIMTLGADCAGVFISDVMGHGTRSALITAIIRTLIDDLESQGRNARHFITEMNRQFCGLLKSVPNPLFASAFYLVADTTARVATYSSAGHPAPFHVRRSVGRVMRMEVPMPRGAALGMIPDETFTGGYCRLTDGDVFLFFTDGVYEAHNVHGEEFGIARMEEVLKRLMYRNAKEMVDGLMDAIATFVSYEPIMDDICIVAIEVTTKAAR